MKTSILRPKRAIARHRVLVAAILVGVEIAASFGLGAFDPGAHLLAGGAMAGLALFALGAFFCLRFVVYFVVPPALAVGLVALVLPRQKAVLSRQPTARIAGVLSERMAGG